MKKKEAQVEKALNNSKPMSLRKTLSLESKISLKWKRWHLDLS
jgi:hypothetical protein